MFNSFWPEGCDFLDSVATKSTQVALMRAKSALIVVLFN